MARHTPEFLPGKKEVYSRGEALQWMQNAMKWPQKLIDQIMYDDSPDIDTLRRLVYDHGPDKAAEIIQAMNEDDDDDRSGSVQETQDEGGTEQVGMG